jgi:hypothetical protein
VNGGSVSIVVPKNIFAAAGYEGLVQGGRLNLDASQTDTNPGGGIGNSTSAPIVLDSGNQAKDTVTVNANGNVFVKEKAGDLRVNKIVSATGSVWVNVAAGGMIDGNKSQTVDERTRAQLEGGLWTDLGLTADTGANQKVLDAIAGFKATKEQEYRTYWKYRNTQANPATTTQRSRRSRTSLRRSITSCIRVMAATATATTPRSPTR